VTFIYVPMTELEYWILLGICQAARKELPGSVHILLKLDHPRLRDRFAKLSSLSYDRVIDLPFFDFSSSVIETHRKVQDLDDRLQSIGIPPKAVFLACGWSELTHWVIIRSSRRCSGDDHFLVSVHAVMDIVGEHSRLCLFGSMVKSLYSVLLLKGLARVYRDQNTGAYVGNKLPKRFDLRVNIGHSTVPSQGETVANGFPFPDIEIERSSATDGGVALPEDGVILLLLDGSWPSHGVCSSEDYWAGANQLIDILEETHEFPVFVKLHPGNPRRYLDLLRSSNVNVIDSKTSAEELYLLHRARIRAVMSCLSTALVTASIYGIPAFDCSVLMAMNAGYLENVKAYYGNALNIGFLSSLDDARSLLMERSSEGRPSLQLSTWHHFFDCLECDEEEGWRWEAKEKARP
jgi:hypothetical protein